MIVINKVLVPTDFSDYSAAAMRYACEVSRRFGSQMHLLHVVADAAMLIPETTEFVGEALADATHAAITRATERLNGMPNCAFQSDREVIRCVRAGSPVTEIVRYAKEADVDLIVLGTHGRTGLSHLLMGSVAENIVRIAPCSVLTVKPEGHQFVMP
ncbi:MAG: universal stress protein [Planctomycetaceae bacterium]|nr:universal stress protein [Planctomycetaceae bacterium]